MGGSFADLAAHLQAHAWPHACACRCLYHCPPLSASLFLEAVLASNGALCRCQLHAVSCRFAPPPQPSSTSTSTTPRPRPRPRPCACRRDIHKVDRPPLQLAIMERILSGGHRTADPAEADFFYIPASARDLKKAYMLQPLLSYISESWPFWNQTGGRRHVMPAEGGLRLACADGSGACVCRQRRLVGVPEGGMDHDSAWGPTCKHTPGARRNVRVRPAECACPAEWMHRALARRWPPGAYLNLPPPPPPGPPGLISLAAGDVGTCELPLKIRLFAVNVTFLQFWGMYDFHPKWEQIFHNRIPCMVPGRVRRADRRAYGRGVPAGNVHTCMRTGRHPAGLGCILDGAAWVARAGKRAAPRRGWSSFSGCRDESQTRPINLSRWCTHACAHIHAHEFIYLHTHARAALLQLLPQDIVVPFMAMSSHDRFVVETPLHPRNKRRNRTNTFFFAGGVCGSGLKGVLPPNCTYYKHARYSGGVRQEVGTCGFSWEEAGVGQQACACVRLPTCPCAGDVLAWRAAWSPKPRPSTGPSLHAHWLGEPQVYLHFHGRPGWRVVARTDDYARDYASSKFCLAAAGGGWGKRGIVAAMYGCIPVAATDMLYEAFEPEMDWSRWGRPPPAPGRLCLCGEGGWELWAEAHCHPARRMSVPACACMHAHAWQHLLESARAPAAAATRVA